MPEHGLFESFFVGHLQVWKNDIKRIEFVKIAVPPDGRTRSAITCAFPVVQPFPRPGRATIVLAKQPDGRWVGVHSHMSLGKGVPQDSFASRPVKAR